MLKQFTVLKYLLPVIAFFFGKYLHAADSTALRPLHEMRIQYKSMQVDKMGNLYVVSAGNQLFKYASTFEKQSTLNYAFSGSIDAIDVSNPLEIYVFYKELNQVLLLDNNLAYRGKINLTDWGIRQAACIARSYDNGIWVFDLGDFQLKKFDKKGILIQSSGNFRQFNQAANFAPIACIDDGNTVLLADSISGVFQFDVFGNFVKKYQVSGVCAVQLLKESFLYIKDNELFEQAFLTPKKSILQFKEDKIRFFTLQNTTIILGLPAQIKCFKYSN
jgi:hypothetical protein